MDKLPIVIHMSRVPMRGNVLAQPVLPFLAPKAFSIPMRGNESMVLAAGSYRERELVFDPHEG